MPADDNKALVRRRYAEISASNLDAMDELVAGNYVDHHPPPFPVSPGAGDRIAADGTTVVLGTQVVRNGEPYTRPLGMEYPACRCARCQNAEREAP